MASLLFHHCPALGLADEPYRLWVNGGKLVVFKVGQTVRLISGGPLMTVCQLNMESYTTSQPVVMCAWFDNTGNFQTRWILDAILILMEKADD